MNKTKREIIVSNWNKFGKKNKFCRILAVAAIYAVFGYYALLQYLIGNTKRLCGIATVWLLFVVSCSFSLPAFVEVTEVGVTQQQETVKTNTELIDEILAGSEVAIIDDNDVLDGYEDADLTNENVDLYTVDEILQEEKELTEESRENTPEKEENQNTEEAIVLDKNDWKLLLINKQHPVPEDYSVELGIIKNNMKCDKRIMGDLLTMLQAAKEDGIDLVICSPYRDYNRQEVLFERKIKAYMAKGLSYMEAYMVSSQAVTVPGASEHQIGLALDIVCNNYLSLDEGFGETQAGKWLYENACQFGFIQRYPKGKEHITGIMYEPWHYRYVGEDAAGIINHKNITLEELVEGL